MAAEKQISSVILCGCGVIGSVLAGAIVRLKEEASGRRAQVQLVPGRTVADLLKGTRRKYKQLSHVHLVGVEFAEWERDVLAEVLRTAEKDGVQVIRYAPEPLGDSPLAGLMQEVTGDVQPFEYFVYTSRPTLTAARQRTADVLAHSAGNAFFNELYRTAAFICRAMPGRAECCAEVTDSLMQHLCSLAKETDLTPAMRRYRELYRLYGQREMLGESAAMETLRGVIAKVAAADDVRVLIQGPTGTGKGSVAAHIHLNSRRWQKPLVPFPCATAPQQAERMLLGYKKNAFPGATQDRKGLLDEAQGGTLVLDEVGDLPPEIQTLLLRVLEEKKFLPLGGVKEVAVDVRVVATTNKDLRQAVQAGSFRADLLYRLQEFTLHTPALKEMGGDLPRIADSLWRTRNGQRLPEGAAPVLQSYPWPGNVRELANFLKYAHIMGGKDWPALLRDFVSMNTTDPCPAPAAADPEKASDSSDDAAPATMDTPLPLEEMVRAHCRRVLDLCNGNQSRAAEHLGISRNTLRRYI